MALQLSFDGAAMTKLRNHSSTIGILLNLNLPPEERYQSENILFSFHIPGPKKCIDLDSFLQPLVDEMIKLHHGVKGVYNCFTKSDFELHAWIVIVSADGPARAEGLGMNNPGNAFKPCPYCFITGTLSGGRYHVVHPPNFWRNPPMRTNLREVIAAWDLETDISEKNKLSTLYGIRRVSILLQLPSLHFPRSFPIDIIHCFLLNVTPYIIGLWGGQKLVDKKPKNQPAGPAQKLDYVLNKDIWIEVGTAQETSRAFIPRQLGQAPRRIDKYAAGMKSAEWEALLVRDGLTLFEDFLDLDPFMVNFARLRSIYISARSWHVTPEMLKTLEIECPRWVTEYESLYYKGELSRASVCKINGHHIGHLGRDLSISRAC